MFKLGDLTTSTADKKHTGRKHSVRTQANIDLIQGLLEDDRRKTIRELVVESGLSQGSVHRIVQKEL